MNAVHEVDDLVRDYLLFRSFTQTLRSFEADIKADKEKGFEVSQIIDEMFDCVRASDIRALFGYWAHLDRRYFSKLEAKFSATVKKLEVSLLRYYLVFAAQQRRRDKLMEFFETYGSDLHPAEEWMAWFALPFCSRPENSATFATYFTSTWLDTFKLSLHNFLSAIFCHMPPPSLLKYPAEKLRTQTLEREVEFLRSQIDVLKGQLEEREAEVSMLKTKDFGMQTLSPTYIYATPLEGQGSRPGHRPGKAAKSGLVHSLQSAAQSRSDPKTDGSSSKDPKR